MVNNLIQENQQVCFWSDFCTFKVAPNKIVMKQDLLSTDILIKTIEDNNFDNFKIEWGKIKDTISEKEKQNLLVEIVDGYFTDNKFPFFKKVFDKVIDKKLNLNYNIDLWAPSILCLSISKFSKQLFVYLIENHASINYVADRFAFEDQETIDSEAEAFGRYFTCLDFAESQWDDLITIDFLFPKADFDKMINLTKMDNDPKIKVSRAHYRNLLRQSKYLHNMIELDRIIDKIKSLDGKTADKLNFSSEN